MNSAAVYKTTRTNYQMKPKLHLICEQNKREVHGSLRVQEEVARRLRNINIIRTDYKQTESNIKNKIYTLLMFPIRVFLRSRNCSINHFFHQNFAYIICLLPIRNPIVTCYDLIFFKDKYVSPFQRTFNNLCLNGMKRADKIITGSEFSKKDIVECLNIESSKVKVAPFAYDSELYKQTETGLSDKYGLRNNKIVLYVGSEQKRKNVDKILKAIALVKKKCPGIVFVKVGKPGESSAREKLMDLIYGLKIDENVRFIDYIEEEDLPPIYNMADVFVFPSSYEGFGLPVIEAMACGCPVITTKKTSLVEVAGDAAICVDPNDIEELARMIIRVLDDKEVAEKLRKKGLLQAKKFRWETTVKVIEQVYRNTLNGH